LRLRTWLWVVLIALDAGAQEFHLELSHPEHHETIDGALPLVAIRGTLARSQGIDLMLALDVSESVFLPACDDVDRDGSIGGLVPRWPRSSDDRRLRIRSSDPGDTVFEAERAGARAILASLARTGDLRAGLVTFGETARVRARLGPVERATAALDALRAPGNAEATDISRGIELGQHLLGWDRDRTRRRVLLVLSDGHETRRGSRSALSVARAASRRGIEIHTIAVGPDAAGPNSRYAAIALHSGGTYLASRALPGRTPWFLSSPLRPTSIEVVNDTTGEPARALRLEEDGRFDGFVRLQPGANRLAIRARTADGARQGASRTVFFRPPARRTARDHDLLRSLRARAQEIADTPSRGKRRTLAIEAER